MMFQKPHYAKPQNVSSHPLPPLQPFINLDDFHLAKPIFATLSLLQKRQMFLLFCFCICHICSSSQRFTQPLPFVPLDGSRATPTDTRKYKQKRWASPHLLIFKMCKKCCFLFTSFWIYTCNPIIKLFNFAFTKKSTTPNANY